MPVCEKGANRERLDSRQTIADPQRLNNVHELDAHGTPNPDPTRPGLALALLYAALPKERPMTKYARDVMTPDPACCTPEMTLDQVAKLMVQNDCGEIPVID